MVVIVMKLNILKKIYPIQLCIKYFPTEKKISTKPSTQLKCLVSWSEMGVPSCNHCHAMAGLIRTLLFGRENLNELVSYLI